MTKMTLWDSFPRSTINYHRIETSPPRKFEQDDEQKWSSRRPVNRNRILISSTLAILCIIFVSIYCLVVRLASKADSIHHPQSTTISSPSFRREWRSLASEEKLDYIRAVKCLKEQPSRIGLNHTLYDDFPWVHARVGEYSHESAAFLAWHRYFLSVYEAALREQCNYGGHLPYWDWTLDWENIAEAPVWHDTYGFGGTGDPAGEVVFLDGHCVTTGPFANLEILYAKNMTSPHCLCRGILDPDSQQMHDLREWIRPSNMARIMSIPDYERFNLQLERNSHIAIPRMIRGDFLLLTAPSDPVFFLHHAQLDRIWFKWQKLGPNRVREYEGLAAHNVTRRASLQDTILMGGLAPDVKVESIVDTTAGILDYVYF